MKIGCCVVLNSRGYGLTSKPVYYTNVVNWYNRDDRDRWWRITRIDRILRAPQNCNANRSYRHNCRTKYDDYGKRFSNRVIANCLLSEWIISPMKLIQKTIADGSFACFVEYFNYSCLRISRGLFEYFSYILKSFYAIKKINYLIVRFREESGDWFFFFFPIKMTTCCSFFLN